MSKSAILIVLGLLGLFAGDALFTAADGAVVIAANDLPVGRLGGHSSCCAV